MDTSKLLIIVKYPEYRYWYDGKIYKDRNQKSAGQAFADAQKNNPGAEIIWKDLRDIVAGDRLFKCS